MNSLGHQFENDEIFVFFGNRRFLAEGFLNSYPAFRPLFLKQTHSSTVVEAPAAPETEADAHLTAVPGLALCVRTADCLPVMIYDAKSHLIASVHAGWRGIENEILLSTCERMKQKGAHLSSAQVWIGPHIGFSSFEVGRDVGERLLNAYRRSARDLTDGVYRTHSDLSKLYINLNEIARAQLTSIGISSEQIQSIGVDTFASADHASFRREPASGDRQISFIALKK
jgi:polyphenol oxidase